MFESVINNLDKTGLLFNIVGTFMVAFAFGPVKDAGASIGNGKGDYPEVSVLKSKKLFYYGLTILGLGFLIQLFN